MLLLESNGLNLELLISLFNILVFFNSLLSESLSLIIIHYHLFLSQNLTRPESIFIATVGTTLDFLCGRFNSVVIIVLSRQNIDFKLTIEHESSRNSV